jgi:2-keto-3-deoxy-6-phosphogluconate aldolase
MAIEATIARVHGAVLLGVLRAPDPASVEKALATPVAAGIPGVEVTFSTGDLAAGDDDAVATNALRFAAIAAVRSGATR